ncbi:MAG: SET domain-containing protein-lysine N-methyltransferase [Ignavibacteriales bacterium]|nr:SET domain-containing protein-lysine N-methyltransferase [Ignavibacteriales bacterium]
MVNPNFKIISKRSSIDRSGVFSESFIPRGTELFHYEGELISSEEALKRESDNTREGIYTFWLNDEWAIDGWEKGNISKYLNHSCAPNCSYNISEHHISIFTERDIFPNEELTIDYDYDADAELTRCLCGSDDCRGFINSTNYEKEAQTSF